MKQRDEPVFIGPVCVGKTTVAALVADALGLPCVELDDVALPYYEACPDFEPDEFNRLEADEGFLAAYRYFERALPHAVERLIDDHAGSVLDLGAGHSCFLDRSHAPRIQRALEPFRHVVFLLPDRDGERSVRIIRERSERTREGMTWLHDGVDLIRLWVTDEQNFRLATDVVYTGDDGPEQVAERVIQLIG